MKKLTAFCALLAFGFSAGAAETNTAQIKSSPIIHAGSGSQGLGSVTNNGTLVYDLSAEPKSKSKLDFATPAKLTEKAPEAFKARFETSKGAFTIEVTRSLAPNGADRFYNLVRSGFFTDVEFFRVIPGFMCQFGIHGDPKVSAAWRGAQFPDDPVKASNVRGSLTFATAGPNTRTTQLFINFADNNRLDGMGFSPFGKVVEGMDVVDKINGEYGEGAPRGRGPDQGRLQEQGNAYLKKDFPKLDFIKSATLLP
jgi:peptidyl-prolyl cis-trans isomerase A (cyclophilin A)